MLVADAHTDLLLELGLRLRAGEERAFAATWLPLLEAGGVRVQVCPVFVEPERQPEGSLREALLQAAAFAAATREEPQRVAAVTTAAGLDDALAGGRIALVLALEGLEPLGHDVWPLDVFHALGVRMASLTWNRRNPFADGLSEDGGLSRRGAAAVDRMAALGIAIDLAHASPRTFADVLARSGDAPVLVSHAGCRALSDHRRNLGDDALRELAARGGVFGLMLHPLALGYDDPSVARACAHLEHAAGVMGVDRVVLGGDFSERLNRLLPATPAAELLLPDGQEPGTHVPGLEGPDGYPGLADALRARGWAEHDVDAVMGGNLIRFLRRALR